MFHMNKNFKIVLPRIFHKKRIIFFTNCYDTVCYNIKYGENAMTKCTQSDFGFPACKSRKITLDFLGGNITSNGGILLLKQADAKLTGCKNHLSRR